MSSKRNHRFGTRRSGLLLALLAAITTGAMSLRAANILFVVTASGFVPAQPPANANDLEVYDRLVAQQHRVTVASDAAVTAADTTGKDLVIISSSVSSTGAGVNPLCKNTLQQSRIPVVSYEPALLDELLMQRATTYDTASTLTQLGIVAANKNHPLAAGKTGIIDCTEAGQFATVTSPSLPLTLGTDALIIATNASPDVTTNRVVMFAYDVGSRLADNVTACAGRRVAFFYNATTAAGVYNTNAWALFDASVKWALTPPANLAPAITITQPANGATFPAGANIAFAVTATDADGSVAKVEYFAGTNKIGQATSAPFGFTWTNVPTARYLVSATATDNGGAPGTSQVLSLTVGTPPPEVLLVAGAVPVNASETAIQNRLQSFGMVVRTILTGDAVPNDATNLAVIVISSSVTSGDITKYRDVPVPLINWEWLAFDGLGMADADYTSIAGQTDIEIVKSNHPLAAGLPAGMVTIFSSASAQIAAAYPVANATVVANAADGSGSAVLFGLEKGDALSTITAPGLKAPARRVGIFLGGDTFTQLNTNGLKLFDAALAWSLNRASMGVPPNVSINQPTNGAVLAAGANISLGADATDDDGSVVKVEFFAGANKVGEATSAPFKATWTNVITGVYTLTAKATDNSGFTKLSSPINITVGTPGPTVLLVVSSAAATLNASDAGIKAHLESLGFLVLVVGDTASATSDASGKVLVVNSATVISGNVGNKFRDVAVPVLNLEQALEDNYLLTFDTGADHGETAGQTDLIITDATHPLAAGLSAGTHTVTTTPLTFTWGTPNIATAKVIATLNDGSGSACLYAYDKGALLIDGVTAAPERRVHLFPQNDGFAALTPEGLKLFNAALSWAMNRALVKPAPKFNPVVLQGVNVTLSWTGTGTLQQEDKLDGSWSDAPNQANPQTIPSTGSMRFYRLRQ